MLWLGYFLGVRFLLNGGGIVHKGFEINLVPKIGPRGVFGGGNRCETTIPNFGASEGQIGPLSDVVETGGRRVGDEQVMSLENR